MKDMGALLKQAQAMQEKLQAAQAELARSEVEGVSGGSMVRLTLTGDGALARVSIDESLLVPGEAEIIGDLIVAAHADAKAKIDAAQGELMRQTMGPMAGAIPGLPGMKF